MTGWAWLFLATTWALAGAWILTVWQLRSPILVFCACGKYRMHGWVKIRDETGWHDPDRCQPSEEAL